jgi:hypothetical protein
MLFLAEALLYASGFVYDDIQEMWVHQSSSPPGAAVECDEDGVYLTEALRQVDAVLRAKGCTYSHFSISDHLVSVVGLAPAGRMV